MFFVSCTCIAMHVTNSFYIRIMLFLVVLYVITTMYMFCKPKKSVFMQPTFKLKIEKCFCILLNVIREPFLNFFSVLKFESTIHV